MRTCSKCAQQLPADAFYKRHNACKECRKAARRAAYWADPVAARRRQQEIRAAKPPKRDKEAEHARYLERREYYLAKQQEAYQETPFRVRHRLKRSQCKRRGIPFDLTESYLVSIWTGYCAASGVELHDPRQPVSAKDKPPNYPELDRIDPALGYTQGNVRWVASAVNLAKGVWTRDEVSPILRAWLKC